MFQTTNQIISQEVSARFELHSMASPISMTIYIYNYIMMKLNSIIHQKMCVCSYWFASPRVSGNIMDIQQMFFPQVRFKKNRYDPLFGSKFCRSYIHFLEISYGCSMGFLQKNPPFRLNRSFHQAIRQLGIGRGQALRRPKKM